VLADLPHHDLTYGDHRGHPDMRREALAAYLARVRAVRTTPDLVVMTNGFSAASAASSRRWRPAASDRIAVEDPGGYEPRRRLQAAGGEVVPIPVDDDGCVSTCWSAPRPMPSSSPPPTSTRWAAC
jgi:GntR family transcriptional regulator / MocR family aminotransferase